MKWFVHGLIAAVLSPLALAQPPSTSGGSNAASIWDQYDGVSDCVVELSAGHSFNEDPVSLIPTLLSGCQSQVIAARSAAKQMGYTHEEVIEFEDGLQDSLVKVFTDEFTRKRAELEPERLYARSIYRAAISCASKLAVDYKELGAGDPAVFWEFLNGQCSFKSEIEAVLNSGLDVSVIRDSGVAAKTCGFAKALDNLKHRLDPETADAYTSCPAYVEMINGRPPP